MFLDSNLSTNTSRAYHCDQQAASAIYKSNAAYLDLFARNMRFRTSMPPVDWAFPFDWDGRCVPEKCRLALLFSFSAFTRQCVLQSGNPNTEQVCLTQITFPQVNVGRADHPNISDMRVEDDDCLVVLQHAVNAAWYQDMEARMETEWQRYDSERLDDEWTNRLGALTDALVPGYSEDNRQSATFLKPLLLSWWLWG